MKNILILVSFLAVITLMPSCKKDENNTSRPDYLPMQVQNYWEIQNSVLYTIIGTKVIEDKTYYVFAQGDDTSYYRNANDKIYVRRSTGPESVKFDLAAGIVKSWEFNDGGTIWSVSRNNTLDTITINNTKIPNCYQFSFDLPMTMDANYGIWLAPGIGFIKISCGFCPYPSHYLKKAVINNKEITFP